MSIEIDLEEVMAAPGYSILSADFSRNRDQSSEMGAAVLPGLPLAAMGQFPRGGSGLLV